MQSASSSTGEDGVETAENPISLVSPEQPSSSALIPSDDSILSYGKMAQAFEDDDEPFLLPPTALPNMAGPAAVNSMLQVAIPDAQSESEQSESTRPKLRLIIFSPTWLNNSTIARS